MEAEKTLRLPDGKTLYYVHTSAKQKNRKLVIHIHGLSGWAYDYAATRMARKFPNQGYDVIRPHLYYYKDGARVLHETTITINAADISALINDVHNDYDKIYLTGHSYGGPVAMLLQDHVDGISLWDPTYVPGVSGSDPAWRAQIGGMLLSKGSFWFLISEAFDAESRMWNLDYVRRLSATWSKPLQVIQAADGYWINKTGAESFHTNATGPTDYRVINGTVHCFVEEGTTTQLLDATRSWFDRS